jgi:PleD family two-component response regulator
VRNSRLTREPDVETAYLELFDGRTRLAKPALVRDRLEIALARATRRDRIVGILFVAVEVPADLLPRNVRALDPVQLIAGRLRSAVRPDDTVGRMGKYEFVAIVNDLLDPTDVDAIEQRLRDVLGVRIYLDESRSVLSVAVETRIGRPGDRALDLLAR